MLGPPVCVECERVFDYLTAEEQQEMRKTYPKIGRWWCSECKSLHAKEHVFTIDKALYARIFGLQTDAS